jgi:hypothetical protein
MKTNLKEILEAIPDFEDFTRLAEEIGTLSLEKMRLENKIDLEEARTVTKVTKEPEYFIGGKPASMAYIESTYKITGVDVDLPIIRDSYAEVTAKLETQKIRLSIYRDMLDVFRTVSANERLVSA